MRKSIRSLGFLFVCAFTLWGSVSEANGYINVRNPKILLEHSIRNADALLSEINLVRAGGYFVSPVVLQGLPQRSWEGSFYGAILANPQVPVDAQVATQLQNLRVAALMYYDLSNKIGPRDPRAMEQYVRLNRAYHNALAATFFEIEALRRTYIIRGCPPLPPGAPRPDLATLQRRLLNMEALAHRLMDVMYDIRRCATFRLELPNTCMECGRRYVHINITVQAPQQFLTVPYYAGNQWYMPANESMYPQRPEPSQPVYDANANEQRWTFYNGQQGQGNGDYDQGDYTGNQPGYGQPGNNQPQYPGNRPPVQGAQQPYYGPGQQGGYNQPLPPPQQGDGVVPSRDYDR